MIDPIRSTHAYLEVMAVGAVKTEEPPTSGTMPGGREHSHVGQEHSRDSIEILV